LYDTKKPEPDAAGTTLLSLGSIFLGLDGFCFLGLSFLAINSFFEQS